MDNKNMISVENAEPSPAEFKDLMSRTDTLLNERAARDENYFIGKNGTPLEKDVRDALISSAEGTPFQGKIKLVSGHAFPDIVARGYYGVEVKSTKKDDWKSTGSSILESTRIEKVERIYLTFGKLGHPVRFLSRPYEDCLSDIAVTHYPRYKIDMTLKRGETIFDKMGVEYDELRQMENPVEPVSRYYKSKLNPGESLWWASGDAEENSAPPTLRLWRVLSHEDKVELITQGFVLFPEVFRSGDPSKYDRCAFWMITHKSVVCPNLRDSFSAGGKGYLRTSRGVSVKVPAVYIHAWKNREKIRTTIERLDSSVLEEYWGEKPLGDRAQQWKKLVLRESEGQPDFNPDSWGDILSQIIAS